MSHIIHNAGRQPLFGPALQLDEGASVAVWSLDMGTLGAMPGQIPPWLGPPSLRTISSSEPSTVDEAPDGTDEPRFTEGPYADWTFSDVAENEPGHY